MICQQEMIYYRIKTRRNVKMILKMKKIIRILLRMSKSEKNHGLLLALQPQGLTAYFLISEKPAKIKK